MSIKPRANQIGLNTTSFSKNLSIADNDLQKAFNTIDQLSITASHNTLTGIQGGSLVDGYYHFTGPQYDWLVDGYTNNWSASKGGTGITSYASGDIVYASAPNTLSTLAKSIDGYYLQLVSGLPAWQPVDTAGSISVDTINFNNILSSADSTIQLALDTLDDHNHILGNDLFGIMLSDAYVVGIRDTEVVIKSNWISDGLFNYYGGEIRCVGFGGDLYGGVVTSEVRGLYGRAISSIVPEDGYALIYNQGTDEWVPGIVSTDPPDLTLGGDLSGELGDAYVIGFNGYPLATHQTPTDGQVFFYNGAQGKWWCSEIGGDVSGSFESVTVDRIKNIEVDVTGIADGYSLVYNQGTNKWLSSLISTTPGISIHNSLTGIQGGTTNQYYHFTSDEYTWLRDGYTSGKWSAVKGGTGISSYSIGDILYATSSTELSRLPVSTDGYYLKLASGLPSWSSVTTGSTSASGINTTTSNFNSLLSTSDDTVQKALDTLDNHVHALTGDCDGYTSSVRVKAFNGVSLDLSSPSDGYAYVYSQSASKWVPTKVNNSTVITVGKQDILTANATSYILPNFTESTDETAIAFLAPVGGTLSNLVCYCSTAPGGSESVAITVRKNGVDTAITGTISGSATTASDLSHTVDLASGDRITIKSVVTAGSSAANLFVSLIFTVPTMNSAIVSGGSGGSGGYGLYSAMPAAGNAGSTYIATDAYVANWIYDGASWRPFIDSKVIAIKPPLANSFISVNAGAASLIDYNGSLIYTGASDGTNIFYKGFAISNTSSTAYIEACISSNIKTKILTLNAYNQSEIGFRESSTDRSLHLAVITGSGNGNYWIAVEQWIGSGNARSYGLEITGVSNNYAGWYACGKMFLRVRRNITTIFFDLSWDRLIWYNVWSGAISSYFISQPDQVTIGGANPNFNSTFVITHLETGSL